MPGEWKEILKLRFTGPQFAEHGLALTSLGLLSRFQDLLVSTAKAVWLREHQDRKRVPRNYEDQLRLYIRRIERGSAVAPVEVFIGEPGQKELWEPEPVEVQNAVTVIHSAVSAMESMEELPADFPKSLVSECVRWGEKLREEEAIELIVPGSKSATYNCNVVREFMKYEQASFEEQVSIEGEVLEADVRQGRFQLWPDDRTRVVVDFSGDHESTITDALRRHANRRLKVTGTAERTPDGTILKLKDITELVVLELPVIGFDESAVAIEDELRKIAESIPSSAWDSLPKDSNERLDDYLYGDPGE